MHLALAWCSWLMGCWSVTILVSSPVPAVRWMIFLSAMGLTILWPLLRLSQDHHGEPEDEGWILSGRSARSPGLRVVLPILSDWGTLMLVLQFVIWPLRLTSQWSADQTLWLWGAMAVWTLLAGAITAWGCLGDSALRRTLAMIACLLIWLGEPIVYALANRLAPGTLTGPLRVSPVSILHAVSGPSINWQPHPWGEMVFATGTAAVIAWIAVVIRAWADHRAAPPG